MMIRKLNNELNEIIDRVSLVHKRSEKKVDVDRAIKLLEENFKNNQKILERGENEIRKLEEKVSSIKGDDYELETQGQVVELKARKKELEKEIMQAKSSNTKVSKMNPEGIIKSNEILKNDLFHLKK